MKDFRGRSRKSGINKGSEKRITREMKIFIIHNFGPVAELPTSGNGKCSCVMCFSKDVPGGPEGSTESKEASDMMGKAT